MGAWKNGNPGCCCGSAGHTLGGCTCTHIPDTIYMHVDRTPGAGFETFVFPTTFVYQPIPASVSTYRADPVGYYATSDQWSSQNSYKYRFWFGCSGGFYFVTALITPDSPIGFPGEVLIMDWLPGFPNNTCSPFSLHNGSTSNPTYRAQGITVDGVGPPPPQAPQVANGLTQDVELYPPL